MVCGSVLAVLLAWWLVSSRTAAAGGSGEVYLTPDMPIYASPSAEGPILGVISAESMADSLERRSVLLRHNPMAGKREHPLTMWAEFHRIPWGGGKDVWVTPDLQYYAPSESVVPLSVPSVRMQAVVVLLVIGFSLLLWGAYRRGDLACLLRPRLPVGRGRLLVWGALLVGVYLVALSVVLFFAGNVVARPTDEVDYFGIARDILAWRRPQGWSFNVSVAILYMPLILLTGASDYLDIAPLVVGLQSLVLTPLCYILVFAILARLTGSARGAFVAVLLLILLPLLYCPVELHAREPGGRSVFKAITTWPLINGGSYHLYYLFVWYGRNGLSDTPAAALVLLALWLGIRGLDRGPSTGRILVTSAVFGMACFMRINNIFLAPLVAYCFWRQGVFGGWTWRRLCGHAAAAAGVFTLCLLPQFVANLLQFGSPLTFPYVLHTNQAAQGFEVGALASGTAFLVGTNYLYMTLCLAGVATWGRSVARSVLVFWVVPMLVFFCGYVVVGASPMRFILPLYGGCLGAFVCAPQWREAGAGQRILAVSLIMANAVLVSPCQPFSPPYALRLDPAQYGVLAGWLAVGIPLVSIALAAFFLRGRMRLMLLVFFLLFGLGAPHLVGLGLTLMLLWEAVRWGREICSAAFPARVACTP